MASTSTLPRPPQTWSDVTLSDGNRVPAIAFGVGTAFFQDSSRKTVDAIKDAVLAGYRHLDTAQSYENEKCVKDALVELEKEHGIGRHQLWITTKVNKQVKDLRKTLEGQLKTLGLSYVDAYLIHTPKAAENEGTTNVDLWNQMIELKKAGLAKTIGVSNFRAYHLRELEKCAEMPTINQMEYHPYVHKMFRPVIEYCQEKHIVLEAYSALAPIRKFAPGPCDEPLEDIAKKVGERSAGQEVNTGQICSMYIHAVGGIPISTSGKRERMEEQLRIQTFSGLERDEVAALEKAGDEKPFLIEQRQADNSEYVTMPDSFE